MSISVTCSACGKRLKAKDEHAGRVLPCPSCQQKIHIPEPDEDTANYSLQAEESPPPQPEPTLLDEESALVERKPKPTAVRRRTETMSALPPLAGNEPPLWLRHLHWLLVLALLPLAFSLLNKNGNDDIKGRIVKTIQAAPPDVQLRIEQLNEDASDNEFFALLPGRKLLGALLPRDSYAHWALAAVATVLFMAFFILLASGKTAQPHHLLLMGLFTATIGIMLLLLLQLLADWSQGVWLRGGNIVVVLFYIVKFIGFSYRAALDPSNGFILSFLGYTLGVGFCEEVCKALPLLWHYSQRGSVERWRTAFLWGLASGAGFGISEGITYASRYYNGVHGGEIYLVRFVSCVALHALWTGSVAITLHQRQELIQGVDSWYEYIPRLYLIVGVPMVLHGFYDTFLKKEMNAAALGVAVLSFLFLAFQISRLHGEDDEESRTALLREYKRRRAAMS